MSDKDPTEKENELDLETQLKKRTLLHGELMAAALSGSELNDVICAFPQVSAVERVNDMKRSTHYFEMTHSSTFCDRPFPFPTYSFALTILWWASHGFSFKVVLNEALQGARL